MNGYWYPYAIIYTSALCRVFINPIPFVKGSWGISDEVRFNHRNLESSKSIDNDIVLGMERGSSDNSTQIK